MLEKWIEFGKGDNRMSKLLTEIMKENEYYVFIRKMKEQTGYSDEAIEEIYENLYESDNLKLYSIEDIEKEFIEFDVIDDALKELDLTYRELENQYVVSILSKDGVLLWNTLKDF